MRYSLLFSSGPSDNTWLSSVGAGIDLAIAARCSYFLYLEWSFLFSLSFILWIFATWSMSLCQIKLRNIFKQNFGDFRKVEVFLHQGVFWSLTILILFFRLLWDLQFWLVFIKHMRGPYLVDAFNFNSLLKIINIMHAHCWKSGNCIKAQSSRKKTCIIWSIIFITLFQNMHGVKHIIDV